MYGDWKTPIQSNNPDDFNRGRKSKASKELESSYKNSKLTPIKAFHSYRHIQGERKYIIPDSLNYFRKKSLGLLRRIKKILKIN